MSERLPCRRQASHPASSPPQTRRSVHSTWNRPAASFTIAGSRTPVVPRVEVSRGSPFQSGSHRNGESPSLSEKWMRSA